MTAAICYFCAELKLNKTSVRRFTQTQYKTQYLADSKETVKKQEDTPDDNIVQESVSKKTGRPLLVSEDLDAQVREYVKELP